MSEKGAESEGLKALWDLDWSAMARRVEQLEGKPTPPGPDRSEYYATRDTRQDRTTEVKGRRTPYGWTQ